LLLSVFYYDIMKSLEKSLQSCPIFGLIVSWLALVLCLGKKEGGVGKSGTNSYVDGQDLGSPLLPLQFCNTSIKTKATNSKEQQHQIQWFTLS
jgi:hypothetical protein